MVILSLAPRGKWTRRAQGLLVLGATASLVLGVAQPGAAGMPAGQPDATFDEAAALEQVAATSPTEAELAGASPQTLAEEILRCFDLDGLRYCLGYGFGSEDPDYAQAAEHISTADEARSTGDMSLGELVHRRAELPRAERVAVEQREVRNAIAARDRAKTVQEVVDSTNDAGGAPTASYPEYNYIMSGYQTEQECSDFCGPAVMQSLDWADDGTRNSQSYWAGQLGSGSCGNASTWIGSLVAVTNSKTGWDNANNGDYYTQDVSGWSTSTFMNVHASHLSNRPPAPGIAPIIEHPVLRNEYFDYLRYDAGGHFQVGRGYSLTTDRIAIFEVWDERDWTSDGNPTAGKQYVTAYNLRRATQAHPQHNIGL